MATLTGGTKPLVEQTGVQGFTRPMIDRIVDSTVGVVSPLCVRVFGSRVRGEATRTSDVDLLVVVPDEAPSGCMVSAQIRQALDWLRMPVDIVVERVSDYVRRRDVFGTVEWSASTEGICLYGQP